MQRPNATYRTQDFWRKRSQSNFVTATVSMALVLFFLGLFVGIVFFGQELAERLRSKLEMKVFLHDGIGEMQQQEFELLLRHHPAITSLRFISKEEAAKLMAERTGEDLTFMLDGANPLPASYNLLLKPAYLRPDSLSDLRLFLEGQRPVAEVLYQGERLNRIDANLRTLSILALSLGLILSLVAFYLIFTTIRLSIYARRLSIRSMELVGATRGFILRPFLWRGLLQGFLAGFLAIGLLVLVYWLGEQWLIHADLPILQASQVTLIGLLTGIMLFGLTLGLGGSYFAVTRYLNRSLDELM